MQRSIVGAALLYSCCLASDCRAGGLALLQFQRAAKRSLDVAMTAMGPGMGYEWDADRRALVRSDPGGTLFIERAETVGRGRFELGTTYMYVDADELDGSQPPRSRRIVNHQFNRVYEVVDRLRLRSHVYAVSATYGLTDRWDVNVLVPLVANTIDVRGGFLRFDGEGSPPEGIAVDQKRNNFGVGDLFLRTKYRLPDLGGVAMAATLTLRLPTASDDPGRASGAPRRIGYDLRGLRDTTVMPLLVASKDFGRLEVHANVGVEANADDLERSRLRYGIAGVFCLAHRVSILAEFVGNSALAVDHFRDDTVGTEKYLSTGSVARDDLVDAVVAFRFVLAGTIRAQLGARVPINSDGLRPDVIPLGGIEATF